MRNILCFTAASAVLLAACNSNSKQQEAAQGERAAAPDVVEQVLQDTTTVVGEWNVINAVPGNALSAFRLASDGKAHGAAGAVVLDGWTANRRLDSLVLVAHHAAKTALRTDTILADTMRYAISIHGDTLTLNQAGKATQRYLRKR